VKREGGALRKAFDPSVPGRTPPSKRDYRVGLAACAFGYTLLMIVAVAGAWRWAQILAAVANAFVVLVAVWFVGFVNRIRGAQSSSD
jgi:hypothetical protein